MSDKTTEHLLEPLYDALIEGRKVVLSERDKAALLHVLMGKIVLEPWVQEAPESWARKVGEITYVLADISAIQGRKDFSASIWLPHTGSTLTRNAPTIEEAKKLGDKLVTKHLPYVLLAENLTKQSSP